MNRLLIRVCAISLAIAPAVVLAQSNSSRWRTVEGQPIETHPNEKADDAPVFPEQTRAPYEKSVPVKVTVLQTGLNNPWSVAFLPNGKKLITEKPGTMLLIGKDGSQSELSGVPDVSYHGQVGLLDVALDPNFKSNHRIFFTFSEPVGKSQSRMAVAHARLDQDAKALRDVTVIFRAFPFLPTTRAFNTGGRLAIAKDGTLFVTIGDHAMSPPWKMAQNLSVDIGKIIHITAEGEPAPNNPFLDEQGVRPEIWAYGIRSPEGLAFDQNGQLWETENGPRGGDELNKIEPGKNYGWPIIVHGIDYPGTQIGAGIVKKPGMEQPRYYWDPVIAPSGLAFYHGDLFPEWQNSVLVGALRGMMLDRLELKGDKVVAEEPLLTDLHSRIRDVRVGPDGAVYVLTDGKNAKLLKLTPKN